MNRPDKAGEPSMEEILASIRQIIADEPAADQPEPAIEPNPLVPQSQVAKTADARGPLADRLSAVLKSGPLPPTSPLGSKRPLSFDQDLADMFDEPEPLNGSAAAAPKPDMRMPEGLSHPMARKSFVPLPPDEPKDDVVQPLADGGAAALPPQLAPSETLIPPPPFGSSEKAAEAPPPQTFGFPPLRKASFYPPQPKTPAVQASFIPQVDSPADGPAQPVAPGDVADRTPEVKPAAVAADAGPIRGAPPSVDGPSVVETTAAAPVRADAAGSQPEASFSAFTPSSASTVPSSAATPAPSERGGFASASPFASSPRPFGAADVPGDAMPEEPRPFPGPFTGTPPAASGFPGQSRFAPEPDTSSSVAAHQALDALAQGLAASAAASAAPVSPEPPSAAIPLTPVIEPEVSVHSAPAPSTLPATVPPAGSTLGGGRTLEDAVAEMLRPMLQQWVADNMPRIIERALRTEVASTTRPGQKPPGT